MDHFLAISLSFAIAASSSAQQTYLGLYEAGQKIGYSSFIDTASTFDGHRAHRSDSRTVMDLGLLGSPLHVQIDSSSWTDSNGRPFRMTFKMASGGRTSSVLATFGKTTVNLAIDDSGVKSVRTLKLPQGERVVDDPLTVMLGSHPGAGMHRSFYVLDPSTASFTKDTVTFKGTAKTDVRGKSISAQLIEVTDPRASTKLFVSSKGDILKIEGPLGIEMYPVSKAVALGKPAGGYAPSSDLAVSTSIPIDKALPAGITELKIRVTGHDLSGLASDQHQTVTRSGDSWVVFVHPPQLAASAGGTIVDAGKQMPQWLLPDLHVPSDTAPFRRLARRLVGSNSEVKPAALAIKRFVFQTMHANAGIGVLRDASEILRTQEGVCRDYAILTTTILRAAKIPARLASGLVAYEGKFYYHAWAEAWDGKRWLGIDSTVPDEQISAGHVKLGCGSVADAFTFAFLGKVKVEVLESKVRT